MSIIRKTSITVAHTDMPSPTPLVWDVRYTVKSSSVQDPDWHPTAWRRTPLQRLKFLQAYKQKTYAKRDAAQALNREFSWQHLIWATDNVGRAAKVHFADKGGFRGFRLQAVKRNGKWEATVWPGHEDLGWPEGKVARAKDLKDCLEELQEMIREKWAVRTGNRDHVGVQDKLIGTWG